MANPCQAQAIYGLTSTDVQWPSVDPVLVYAKSTTRIICVRKITYLPTTYAIATLSFVDSLTGVTIGKLFIPDVAPVLGDASDDFHINFGEVGTKLSAGANLELRIAGVGAAGRVHVESVQKGR